MLLSIRSIIILYFFFSVHSYKLNIPCLYFFLLIIFFIIILNSLYYHHSFNSLLSFSIPSNINSKAITKLLLSTLDISTIIVSKPLNYQHHGCILIHSESFKSNTGVIYTRRNPLTSTTVRAHLSSHSSTFRIFISNIRVIYTHKPPFLPPQLPKVLVE